MIFRRYILSRFRLFSFFLIMFSLVGVKSNVWATSYDVYGGTKASWPDGLWIPVSSLGDPDDGETERLDFVGDTYSEGPDESKYAFYKYSDSTYAYFRIRVDKGTYTGYKLYDDKTGDWTDSVWVMIDGDADGDPDYALAWDTKSADQGANYPHGLEFQVIDSTGTTWGSTTFDDIDQDPAKKRTVSGSGSGECDGQCDGCWHFDIPYEDGTGYLRIVDAQSTTAWSTTMFIDIAVTWDYLNSASSTANACVSNLPVLSASGTWKLQAGSRGGTNDHQAISTDVAANTNPTDPMAWSNDEPTLVNLVSFTATQSQNGILLEWATLSEINNAGFHIWRSESDGGIYGQITTALIPAEGSATSGATYTQEDTDVEDGRTYYYKLEAMDTRGSSQFIGPVSATFRGASDIPTLSEWGIMALVLLLSFVTFGVIKRRKAS